MIKENIQALLSRPKRLLRGRARDIYVHLHLVREESALLRAAFPNSRHLILRLKTAKKPIKLENFFQIIRRRAKKDRVNIYLCVWGYRVEQISSYLTYLYKDISLLRLEDGFIRSLGTFQQVRQGRSLIVETGDLHYSYEGHSILQDIIETSSVVGSKEEQIVTNLIRKFTSSRTTKYGSHDSSSIDEIHKKLEKNYVLVLGQIETDLSLKYGSPLVKTNLELVKIAKRENPSSTIVYKPHPEVYFRNQLQETHIKEIQPYADFIIKKDEFTITDLFQVKPEVYVITSGGGFEALLYGCQVRTLGAPFYAGWGLTRDLLPFPKRKSKKTLEDIFYSAYIKYTHYFDSNAKKMIDIAEIMETQDAI